MTDPAADNVEGHASNGTPMDVPSNRLEMAPYTLKVNPLVASAYCRFWDATHPDTRFVFCATTGRSGTEALTELFTRTPGCVAVHEPYPKLNGTIMLEENEGRRSLADRVYRVRKAPNVRRGAGRSRCYVETSHIFIKCFWRQAYHDLGRRMRVIHLRRHPVAVARSIAQLGTPPGTEVGNWWYLDHEASGNLLSSITPDFRAQGVLDHPFYRCLWYWYEIEARVQQMRDEAPEIDVHTLSWSDRIEPEALSRLIDWLGLDRDEEAITHVATGRINAKRRQKTHAVPEAEALRDMHALFLERLAAAGHDPATFTPEGHPVW